MDEGPYIDADTVEAATALKSNAVRIQWRDFGLTKPEILQTSSGTTRQRYKIATWKHLECRLIWLPNVGVG